jgi:HK97 family phage major capsid protein
VGWTLPRLRRIPKLKNEKAGEIKKMSDNIIEKAAASGTVLSPLDSPGAMTAQGNSNDNGGVLNPEQSRQFIDYIFDEMVLANDGRKVVMRANTMELDKVRVGSRLVAKATQAEDTGSNAAPAFTKIELTTTKFRLDYELSTESLEDNIEGEQLEDHIVRLMATQFGNDLEDIAINGASGATSGYYQNTLNGFIKQIRDTSYLGAHEAAAAKATMTSLWDNGAAGTTPLSLEAIEAVYNALPRKFKARRQDLKFYMNSKHLQELISALRNIGTVPEAVAARVIDGTLPQIGGPAGAQYMIFGLPVLEVPLYPDNYLDLTLPSNRIWGFQRDVTVHREFKPKKDTMEYTVYVRMGVAVEEKSAIAYAEQA